ncbi:hypothetical protein [Yoonia sp. MH D7]
MSDKDPEERKKENELDPNAQLEKPTLPVISVLGWGSSKQPFVQRLVARVHEWILAATFC